MSEQNHLCNDILKPFSMQPPFVKNKFFDFFFLSKDFPLLHILLLLFYSLFLLLFFIYLGLCQLYAGGNDSLRHYICLAHRLLLDVVLFELKNCLSLFMTELVGLVLLIVPLDVKEPSFLRSSHILKIDFMLSLLVLFVKRHSQKDLVHWHFAAY